MLKRNLAPSLLCLLVLTLLVIITPASAQSRDAQALTILQNSVQAMGGSVPNDSTATGTVTTTAGGQSTQGTIQILTKGTAETSVQISASTTIYAGGLASQVVSSANTALPLESAVTCQAAEFPLPLVAALLNDPDTSFQYVGLETSSGESLYHIKALDSFASQPLLQALSNLSTRDIWIDANTLLPQRISYTRYPAQNQVGTQTDIFYTSYLNSSGILYPSGISESLDGTPWATITIQSVAFNTGLTDSSFPVQVQ